MRHRMGAAAAVLALAMLAGPEIGHTADTGPPCVVQEQGYDMVENNSEQYTSGASAETVGFGASETPTGASTLDNMIDSASDGRVVNNPRCTARDHAVKLVIDLNYKNDLEPRLVRFDRAVDVGRWPLS